jgi:hypothetical protein
MLVIRMGTNRFRTVEYNENIQNDSSLGVSESVTTSNRFSTYKEHEVTANRNWRAIITSGQCATTYAYGYLMQYSWSPTDLYQHAIPKNPLFNPDTYTHRWGDIFRLQGTWATPPVCQASVEEADNAARTSYFSRCYAVESRFQGGTFLGELRETLRMIRSPASALRQGVSRYLNTVTKRCRRAKTKRDVTKAVSGTWLEYQYGWRPLFSDIDEGIRALAQLNRQRNPFEMVVATGQAKAFSQVSGFNAGTISAVGVWKRIVRLDTVTVTYRGNVFGTFGAPDASYLLGLRPRDFFPTVWNLIPYSFLVDYFTNIGDVISSASYVGARTAWTSKTIRSQCKVYPEGVVRLPGPDNSGSYTYDRGGSVGSAELSWTEFERIPSVSVDIPSLELRVPGVGSLKWANIAALGAQFFAARQQVSSHYRNVR